MLYLVTSNRIEALHSALLERLEPRRGSAHNRSPLEPRTLVVDSLAQRRALTMAIAQREGVAINLRFVFLAQWLWRQMAARVPGIAPDTPFDAATLAWRIDRLFADAGFVQRRPRLAPYLDACDDTMRFAFARRCAQLVEHATTYRHDWLERWSRGQPLPAPATIEPGTAAHRTWTDDEAWQRALWQALERDLGLPGEHPAQRFVKSLEAMPGARAHGERTREVDAHEPTRDVRAHELTRDVRAHDLPRELHVVALPAIAPLHQTLLAALARVIDVHVYALQPTRAYWVDIVSVKRMAQLQARGSVHELHTQVGHPLLAAWGAQMQAQHALIQQHLGSDVIDVDAFVEPQGQSRLARMQRAILELDDAATAPDAAVKTIDDSGKTIDDSVEIHIAHSLRRELEAIQQRLLALFAQDRSLAPHEVLLATPDIDEAAPMIDAVFGGKWPPSSLALAAPRGGASAASERPGAADGSPSSNDAHIAYTITGRSQGDDGGAAAALLQLIDTGRGRWSAEDLDTLMHLPLVAQRFGWLDDDLATLRDWIDKAGMRFGLDAEHRHSLELSLPPSSLRSRPPEGAGPPWERPGGGPLPPSSLRSRPSDEADPPCERPGGGSTLDAWTLDDAIERLLMGHAFAPAAAMPRPAAFAPIADTTAGAASVADHAMLRAPLAGRLPAATVGSAHAALLGSLAALQRSLAQWRHILAHAHAPADWQRHLLWAIDTFLGAAQPAEHAGLHALRLSLSAWHARLRAADETRDLSSTLMRDSLEHELRQRAAGAVPSGSLDFASMTGLRRLPFRVVIVFGLNDGAWGASGAPPEWDLMARAPRLGDRQQRQDQRDVLLDLMLAARERFWISWTGRDQRDNHALPPAAVVDEWIEALAAADGCAVDDLRAHIVIEHPLQPFAPELFAPDAPPTKRSHHRGYASALEITRARAQARSRKRDHERDHDQPAAADAARDHDAPNAIVAPIEGDLFGPSTFDAVLDDAGSTNDDLPLDDAALSAGEAPTAHALPSPPDDTNANDTTDESAALDGNDDAAALFVRPLPPVPEAQRRITIGDLQRFFRNPARALLQQRLGIVLPWAEEALRGDEPFELDARDRASLARRLMPALRAGATDEALAAHARATGMLPAAALGNAGIDRELSALHRQADALAGGAVVRSRPITLTVPTPNGTWQLVVELDYLPHDGLSTWRASKLDARARLEAWIEHLALNTVIDEREAGRTVLVTRDRRLMLEPLASRDPADALRELVRLMARGLREPLPFMPELSWQAVKGKQWEPAGDDPTDAQGRDERRDAWVQLAWRGRSLTGDAAFGAVADEVYGAIAQRNGVASEDEL